jgi:hypothetical protein
VGDEGGQVLGLVTVEAASTVNRQSFVVEIHLQEVHVTVAMDVDRPVKEAVTTSVALVQDDAVALGTSWRGWSVCQGR